ncbi:hypothetical protein ACLOJK_019798 [Asimina triloba]
MILYIRILVNKELDKPKNRCGCTCIDRDGDGVCEKVCGIEYSTLDQVATCPIPSPPAWPALLQVPRPEYRAVSTDFIASMDLPDESCKMTQSCPAAVLLTGGNKSLAESLAGNLFTSGNSQNFSDYLDALSNLIPGSDTDTEDINYIEPAFLSGRPLYVLQPQCLPNSSLSISFKISNNTQEQEVKCVQGLHLWRDNSSIINDELFKGYREGNPERKINEVIEAYDLLNSNENIFNVSIWYNATYSNNTGTGPIALVRVPRSLNMENRLEVRAVVIWVRGWSWASNAYLQFFQGSGVKMLFDFVKEMPKPGTQLRLDFSSLLGGLFFTWVILQLLPVSMGGIRLLHGDQSLWYIV